MSKLSRKEMIESIVETEIDRMDMDALQMYAEDKLHEHFDGKEDDYIQDVFEEIFDIDLDGGKDGEEVDSFGRWQKSKEDQ